MSRKREMKNCEFYCTNTSSTITYMELGCRVTSSKAALVSWSLFTWSSIGFPRPEKTVYWSNVDIFSSWSFRSSSLTDDKVPFHLELNSINHTNFTKNGTKKHEQIWTLLPVRIILKCFIRSWNSQSLLFTNIFAMLQCCIHLQSILQSGTGLTEAICPNNVSRQLEHIYSKKNYWHVGHIIQVKMNES